MRSVPRDPTDPIFEVGSLEDREAARREWRLHRYIGEVMRSDLEEIPRSSLIFRRFGIVEDTTSSRLYRVRNDNGPVDLQYVPDAAAFYCDRNGVPVLLEKPPGPQTVDELEEQRAKREKQRSAKKAKPSWMSK